MTIAPLGPGAAAAVPRAACRLPRVAAARRLVEMSGAAVAVPRCEPTPRGRGRRAHRGKGRERRSPAEELVRALRHGEFGFRGSFERGGYLSFAALKTAFRCSEELWQAAIRLDQGARKTRIDYSRPGFLRALQGHSTDCGHELSYMAAPLARQVHLSRHRCTRGGGDRSPRAALEAAREGASRTTLWSVPCRRSGQRPGASGGAATQLSSAAWKSCFGPASGSSAERTGCCWRTSSLPAVTSAIFRILAADNQRAGSTRKSWPRSARTVG